MDAKAKTRESNMHTTQSNAHRTKRVLVWKKIRGLWKNKKSNPLQELDRMRSEWNRN